MKTSEKIISEIMKKSFSIENLEKEYDKIKEKLDIKDISNLSLREVRILLSFEHLKDGAEKDYAREILLSNDPMYKNKNDLIRQLQVFGY